MKISFCLPTTSWAISSQEDDEQSNFIRVQFLLLQFFLLQRQAPSDNLDEYTIHNTHYAAYTLAILEESSNTM
jgi:hypothetical protein